MNELKDRLIKTTQVLNQAKLLTYDSYRLLVTDGNEKFILVKRSKFLSRAQLSMWKLSVIEMSKLMSGSTNDHLRITKLLEEIKANYQTIGWVNEIRMNRLELMLASMKEEKMKAKIKDLVELRNQHFAHTDLHPNRDSNDIEIYFSSLKFLIEKAENILTELTTHILGQEYSPSKYNGEDADRFLNEIIQEKEELGKYRLKYN